MTIIDISRPLGENSLAYPGDTAPHFIQSDAGLYLVSDIRLSSHSGTHIDAPVHYLKTGLTVDELPLPHLIGRTGGARRILLRTASSGCTPFQQDYPSLTLDAAEYLTSTGTLCVGIDSFSIEKFDCDGSVHRELLSHGCLIIELLDLSHVPEGDYTLVELPRRLAGLDGAPARVILLDRDGCE